MNAEWKMALNSWHVRAATPTQEPRGKQFGKHTRRHTPHTHSRTHMYTLRTINVTGCPPCGSNAVRVRLLFNAYLYPFPIRVIDVGSRPHSALAPGTWHDASINPAGS